ncbi:MAG: hypothetical protein JWN62_2161, partial [Acidimicrobiales bacterium]|nr:hypothetical protein [Acidimicrobiales bacterium]
ANAQMAGMASAMNRPLVQIPIPTITLPDEAPTGTDPEAGQAGGPGADPGAGGAMGESGADAPSAAFDAVATQVAAINQAMAAQAGASGLPFTPIQVPMDPADAAPDLAAVNAAVAAQVANANAQLAGMASALNVPTVQIPTPTIVLPDGLGDTAMPSASEGAPQDTGAGGAMGESGADAPSAAYDAVATQVAAINQAMAAQAGASGLPFTPIQVPMDPLDAAPDLAAVNAALAAQVASANAQIAGTAAALGLPTVQIPTPTIVLPGGLGDTAVPSAGEGAAQAPTGASAGEAQGHGDAAAYQGAAATNEGAAASDPGTSGAADAATYGAATVAAANTAGMSSADQPSNGAISDGPGVAYAQGGAANVAAGEGAGAPEPAAGDDQDSGFRSAAGSGNTGIMDPFDAHVGQSATSQGAAAGSASTVPDAGGDYSGGGAAGDAGPSEKPSIPDPTDLPDILGGVDATNDISAPAPADDFDLPTIPDAPTGEAPPPPPPADMPALDLPDIPQIPDAPDVPDAPDLSQLPDLPDPPSPPSPPDFSSDDGPSFGDDIGNDVSPSDPTTTDF